MKILELEIKGFRSLKDICWKPGSLNVVIGPNGTGKSNLLRILELISMSAKGKLGKYILNSGGMEPLVWDGVAEAIKFRVNLSLPEEDGSISYEVEIQRIGRSSSFIIEKERLDCWRWKEINEEYTNCLERDSNYAKIRHKGKRKEVKENTLINQETILSAASGPAWETVELLPRVQTNLDSWKIYHDLDVTQQSVIRQAAIARVEKQVDTYGRNLIPVLHTLYTGDRDFKKNINLAMRAAFGNDFEELVFPPAADQRIQLRVRWKSLKREQSAADLSDGTLRFLFLLTVLASPTPAPVIAIDEPETGLHPSMLPIIAEYAVDAAERAQVIFTTHSPQFLDAFAKVSIENSYNLADSQNEKMIWSRIVAEIKKEKSSLGALLEHHGSLVEKNNQVIRLKFDSSFSKNRVSDPDNFSLLETKIKEILKLPIKLELYKPKELSRKKSLKKDIKPVTTVARWSDGKTILNTLDGKELEGWLKEYSLGSLFLSGELESME